MSKTFAFIINYNRLTLPKNMADYLADGTGVTPVIVDNNSDYPPLIEYYEKCPHIVERMNLNYGNCVLWTTGILDKYNIDGGFICTDPDLKIDHIPKDFLHVLQTGLDRWDWCDKCGFSLDIHDLPNRDFSNHVKSVEKGYWTNFLDKGYYAAPIDTTFALFRTRRHSFECIRADKPYCAKHMPWYWTKDNVPEDELYYINSISPDFNYWSKQLKDIVN